MSGNDDVPYCDAQVGGMECGRTVEKWGKQCFKHGELMSQRKPCAYCNDDGIACNMEGEIISDPCWCIRIGLGQ